MKVFVRWCFAFAILLMARCAAGQIDGNSLVILHSLQITDGCLVKVAVTTWSYDSLGRNTDIRRDTLLQYAIDSSRPPSSFRVRDTSRDLSFVLDTSEMVLKNLSIKDYAYSYTYPYPYNFVNITSQRTLHFSDIKLIEHDGNLSFNGVVECIDTFIAGASYYAPRVYASGFCREQTSILDTISVLVLPRGEARVSEAQIFPKALKIYELNGVICATIGDATHFRNLSICDLLGRTIQSHIEASTSIELTALPPGCYFARLSGANGASEVVKFVVAP